MIRVTAYRILGYLLTALLLSIGVLTDDVISPGCKAGEDLEHAYIASGGAVRYHIRAAGHCQTECARDPHTPNLCPAGYYEREFTHGCQNCTGGCPGCADDAHDCILHNLFPNECRYTYKHGPFGHLVPNKRFYKIRQCEKCHESCTECSGPYETDCTQCPSNGQYWPINKRCLKIQWHFVHGRRYQCFAQDHCHMDHPAFEFSPVEDCSPYQIQLFDDHRMCLECTNRYCDANCTYGTVTPGCAFRDLGNGFHCRGKRFRYLAVNSRACVDRHDACASSPCPDDYMCRSTLDWEGYACDCENSTDGPLCPSLTRPGPEMLSSAVNSSSIQDISTSTTTSTTTLTTANIPLAAKATKGLDTEQLIGTSVGCACLLVCLILLVFLVHRYRRQQDKSEQGNHPLGRFLRRSQCSVSGEAQPASVHYKEMADDKVAIVT
eukprot:scpid69907/ scgid5631/ 